jgi:hypothetical protein
MPSLFFSYMDAGADWPSRILKALVIGGAFLFNAVLAFTVLTIMSVPSAAALIAIAGIGIQIIIGGIALKVVSIFKKTNAKKVATVAVFLLLLPSFFVGASCCSRCCCASNITIIGGNVTWNGSAAQVIINTTHSDFPNGIVFTNLSSSLMPSIADNGTLDLGNDSRRWGSIYGDGNVTYPLNTSYFLLRTDVPLAPFTVRGTFAVIGSYSENVMLRALSGVDMPNIEFSASSAAFGYRDLLMDGTAGNFRFFSEPWNAPFGYLIANLYGNGATLPTNRVIFELANGGVFGGSVGLGTRNFGGAQPLTIYSGHVNNQVAEFFGSGTTSTIGGGLRIGTQSADGYNLTVNGNGTVLENFTVRDSVALGTNTTLGARLLINESSSFSRPIVQLAQFGNGDTSLLFRREYDDGVVVKSQNFTLGIDGGEPTYYKTSNTSEHTSTGYGGANTISRIKNNGITDFNHQSRARSSLAAALALTAGANTTINFSVENYDEHAEMNSSGFFTAENDGYYSVAAQVVVSEADGQITFLVRNAAGTLNVIVQTYPHLTATTIGAKTRRYAQISDVVYLAAGDTLNIQVFCPAAVACAADAGGALTYFAVHKAS